MTKEHPHEGLHFGRAYALTWNVAFALHGDSLAVSITRPDIHMQIAGTAHPADVSVSKVVQQVRDGLLELYRAKRQQIAEGPGS
jgi:hypothetical protein